MNRIIIDLAHYFILSISAFFQQQRLLAGVFNLKLPKMADSFETPRVAEPVDADATEQGGPKEVLNGIFLSSRKAQTYDC